MERRAKSGVRFGVSGGGEGGQSESQQKQIKTSACRPGRPQQSQHSGGLIHTTPARQRDVFSTKEPQRKRWSLRGNCLPLLSGPIRCRYVLLLYYGKTIC